MAVFEYQVPKATFSLRNKSSRKLKGGERTLYIKVGIDGGYVMKSTGIWLKPNQWDPAEQMVINSRDAKELNEMLRSLKTKIDRLILTKYGELATANDIRQLLNSSDPERKTHVDFYNYAHEVNQSNYDRGKYGYKSWYSKKRNILMFQKFVQEQLCMTSLTFEDLSVSIFDKYIAYRFNELKNTSREGINKTLVPLYEAIKYAVKNGIYDQVAAAPIVDNYLNVRATKYSGTPEHYKVKFLTVEEMSSVAEFWRSLEPSSRRNALDAFFFSFYSCGLRASDLVTLEWKHIDFKKKEIKKVQVKTKKAPAISIPLTEEALKILDRWRGINSRFVFNWLPEDFDLANDKELLTKINGFDRVMNGHLNRTSKDINLHKSLTLHMARHTFAVIALNKGMDVYLISKLLGHSSIIATEKTYAEFMKDKLDMEAQKILEIEF